MPSLRPLVKPAIKVAAAGLGAVAAGPLGAALGGVLGDALGGESSKLIEKYAEKFGDKAGEKIFEESGEGLLDGLKAEGPTLEAAYRTALTASLKKIASGADGEFDDWFKHWDRCLSSERTLELAGVELAEFTPRSIDRLLERVLVRLDAQGAALLHGGSSLVLAERTMPNGLIDLVRRGLPETFQEAFRALIVSERYESAWRELQSVSQVRLETLVRSVKEDTVALNAKMDEVLRRTAHLAVEEGRLTDAEARAATAEAAAEEWKKKYLEVVKQDPSLDELLLAGDLDAAAEKKREQIAREREAEARSYYELGKIEELRFDFTKATEAYGEAWRLKEDPTYGSAYAFSAQRQNRFAEAIKTFERLRELATDPPKISGVLNDLANLYRRVQEFGKAKTAYDEALRICRELALRNREVYLPYVAMTLSNLANLYCAVRRYGEAEKACDEALRIRRELALRNPEEYLPDVARTLNNLALLHRDLQRFEEAETAYDEALKTYRELRNSEAYLPDVAITLNNLATLYCDVQRFREAEAAYDEVLKTYRELAFRNSEAYLPDVAMTLNDLAILHSGVRRFDKAEKAYDEALKIRRELALVNPEVYEPDVAMALCNLTVLYSDVRQFREAELYSEEAEKILMPFWLKSPGAYGELMARILGIRMDIWVNTGRSRSEVCALARRALSAGPSAGYRRLLEEFISANCSSNS